VQEKEKDEREVRKQSHEYDSIKGEDEEKERRKLRRDYRR
jgi:hypothetical protein